MRLVTFKCPACEHPTGGFVEPEAVGARDMSCEHCGQVTSVDVARTIAAIRPTNTPAQIAEWATERSRSARKHLDALVTAVEAYVRLQDMTIEELPETSPLRVVVLSARVELKKTAP